MSENGVVDEFELPGPRGFGGVVVVDEGVELVRPFEEVVVGAEVAAHSARLWWGNVAGVGRRGGGVCGEEGLDHLPPWWEVEREEFAFVEELVGGGSGGCAAVGGGGHLELELSGLC